MNGRSPPDGWSGNDPLLSETRSVLNQQVRIIQNQQQQATKIIRVVLTIAGLILTASSILLTLLTNNTIHMDWLPNLMGVVTGITIRSFATGLIVFYIFTIFAGAFVVIFISAFQVLSPETKGSGISMLENLANVPLIGKFMVFYVRLLPFSATAFEEAVLGKEAISLRPGIDGDKSLELCDEDESHVLEQIQEYNSGCIQKNEQIINQNRKFLSSIYSTAVVLSVVIFLVAGFLIMDLTTPP